MADDNGHDAHDGTYHVLLIGIDAYASKPLKGCVNDIDSIQRLLLERAKIPASQFTRLVSPHPHYVSPMTITSEPATLENIVAALARLGSDNVAESIVSSSTTPATAHGWRSPTAARRASVAPSHASEKRWYPWTAASTGPRCCSTTNSTNCSRTSRSGRER